MRHPPSPASWTRDRRHLRPSGAAPQDSRPGAVRGTQGRIPTPLGHILLPGLSLGGFERTGSASASGEQ